MMLPLEGITVLDLSGPPGQWVSGSFADFGADVIQVARAPRAPLSYSAAKGIVPAGSAEEEARKAAFNPFDRGKRSIALNLRSQEAREVFYRMAKKADIVIEGFSPGVTKRLGVDYETLKGINPRIICCAITSWGQDGPYRDVIGHDINYVALAGTLDLTRQPGEPPVMIGVQVGDWAGYWQATIGILLALLARDKTGKGQFVDISMTDGVISQKSFYASEYFSEGKVATAGGTVPTGGAHYNSIYPTSDGKYITVGCWEPWLYENLCRALGLEELIPHQYAEGEMRDRAFAAFREVFLTKTRDEWFEFLQDKHICVGPVNTLDEALKDPQVLHRQMVIELDHPRFGKVRQIGIPIKLSETPGRPGKPGPIAGENTDSILKALGYTEEEIKDLHSTGAVE